MTINSLVVPSTGQKGDLIALSADASSDQPGATLIYDWSFGDGATASGAGLTDVTHAYNLPSDPGSPYEVSLTVSDGTSSPATADSPIEIDDVPPTVDLGAAQTVHAGSSVTFNAVVADPAGPSDVASIQWDFNYDGSTFNADVSANGQTTPSYTYATPGTYIVEVQATDLSGNSTIGATAVVVKPPDALIVQAGPDQTVSASPGMMAMQARRCRSTAATATPAARCRRAASLGTSTTAARTRCSAAVRGPCPAAVRASRPRPPAR